MYKLGGGKWRKGLFFLSKASSFAATGLITLSKSYPLVGIKAAAVVCSGTSFFSKSAQEYASQKDSLEERGIYKTAINILSRIFQLSYTCTDLFFPEKETIKLISLALLSTTTIVDFCVAATPDPAKDPHGRIISGGNTLNSSLAPPKKISKAQQNNMYVWDL